MAHIVVNATSLRPGGGLQVIGGLVSCLPSTDRITILWTDPQSHEFLSSITEDLGHIDLVRPIGTTSNMRIFAWCMTSLAAWLSKHQADLLLSINHHYPGGSVPQVIYHLNVLRFERPTAGLLQRGEIADRLRDWRTAVATKSANANIFESRYLLGLAQKKYAIRKPAVIYAGLDETRAIDPQLLPKSVPPHLLAITSPQTHKDNPALLKVLTELLTRRPDLDWRLRIAGGRTPDAFADLKQLATELSVTDRIDWLGFAGHEKLARIIPNSLCLVSTSRVESFGMVALEAMAWGCPAVVCNSTAMPESVGDAGLLADPGDIGAFAGHIQRLAEDQGFRKRLIDAGLIHIRGMSWQSAAKQFSNLFASLLDNNSAFRQ